MSILQPNEPRIGRAPGQLPAELTRAIGKVLGAFPEVIEAHTPIVHTPPFDQPPVLVLAVVMHPNTDAESLIERLGPALAAGVPHGNKLPVMPLHSLHPLMAAVHEVNRPIEIIRPSRGRA